MNFKLRHAKGVILFASSSLLLLSACSTMPSLGGSEGNGSAVKGSAGGASAVDNNEGLERCEQPLGTVSVFEDRQLPWWGNYRQHYPELGSTIPVIRLMIQQSNCFVIVERGRAMSAMTRERELMQQGLLREGSNIGGGQMVAADFTLAPSVLFSEQTGGIGGMLSKFGGGLGSLVGGQMKTNESETNLTLVENRSGVQVASANGSAKNSDFGFVGGLLGFTGSGFAAAGAGGFSNTPEGKVVTAAFADSFNEMVKALRVYKAQTVKGGLGKGGQLAIGGKEDQMPMATQLRSSVSPVRQEVVVASTISTTNVRTYNNDVRLDAYDEDAMKDYYNALKGAVEHMGTFSSFTKEQVEAMKDDPRMKGMATMAFSMIWGGPFVTRLETAQIELDSWPLEAKQQAWAVYGKRIKKYNQIFDRNKARMLANKAFDQSVLDQLGYIELVTEETLFN